MKSQIMSDVLVGREVNNVINQVGSDDDEIKKMIFYYLITKTYFHEIESSSN